MFDISIISFACQTGWIMKLHTIKKCEQYRIESLNASDQINSRLLNLGIYPGALIILKRKAPLFFDPLIFEVDDNQIVMTKDEAKMIEVSRIGS